jgi:hypothetical protein
MAEQVKDFASMSEVVMKKDELIKALIENKAKHDALFEASVIGYWETAKAQLKEKQKELTVALSEFKEDAETQINRTFNKAENKQPLPNRLEIKGFAWSSSLSLAYPENHTKDYERAIRMMHASIYDEVKLSEHEFDQFVLNNWEWKARFVTSNANYLSNATIYFSGCSAGLNGVSGASYYPYSNPSGYIATDLTGSYYNTTRLETLNRLGSGVNISF